MLFRGLESGRSRTAAMFCKQSVLCSIEKLSNMVSFAWNACRFNNPRESRSSSISEIDGDTSTVEKD